MNDTDPKPKPDAIQKVQIEPDQKGWARLSEMYHKYDEERIKAVNEDIDALLVFAGLFSAVLSAFVIETYQNLQEDPSDTHTRILTQISSQLASLTVSGNFINSTIPSYNSSFISPSSFSPPVSFVRINTLWSCSLVTSLITASLGILVKQWFHEYIAQDIQTPWLRLRIRFFRTEGLEKWQVFELAAALPLLLQVALLLFFIGLSEFLRQLNPVVGWATTGIMLAWLAIFVFTTMAPLLSSQCPYKTPILKRPLTYLRTLRPQLLLGALKTFYLILFIPLIPLIPIVICLERLNYSTAYLSWPFGIMTGIYEFIKKSIEQLKRLPEERDLVEEGAKSDNEIDIGIIVSSDSLFQDEQLKRTIGECSDRIPISTIYEYYKKSLKADANRENRDSWRVILSSEAKVKVKEVVGTILLHKHRNPRSDTTWPVVLRSIMTDGRDGSLWNQLPILILGIMQADNEGGAETTFLTLYSSASRKSFDHDGMYKLCHNGKKLDIVDDLISVTKLVGEHFKFWPHPSGSTSMNSHLRDLIVKHDIKKDLGTFCYTLSTLLHLASPEAIENREREVGNLLLDIFDVFSRDTEHLQNSTWTKWWQRAWTVGAPSNVPIDYHRKGLNGTGPIWYDVLKTVIATGKDGALWERLPSLFIQTMQADIEIGASAVFLMLYSSASQKSFNLGDMYRFCHKATKEDIVDNLILVTRLVGGHFEFWPHTPGATSMNSHLRGLIAKHDIKKDLGTFCYTFSTLLHLAPPEAIRNRELEIKRLISDIVDLLIQDTQLPQSTKGIAYLQLAWAAGPCRDIEIDSHRETLDRIGATWPDMLKSIIAAGRHGALWEQLPTLFVQLLQSDIEIEARAVFLMLYFSSTQESFSEIYYLCRKGTKGDIVDTLITITRLVGEYFWSCPPGPTSANSHLRNFIEEHDIKKDLAAFCYTFSVLLLLASPEAIKNREGEVRKLTSDILGILKRDTDLLQNPTRITYWQLRYARDALKMIHDEYHREAMDSNLGAKLRELRDAVYQHL